MNAPALGRIGAGLGHDKTDDSRRRLAALENMGYSAFWMAGGEIEDLSQVADMVRSTERATVGTGIVVVSRFGSDVVDALYREVEATDPGRLVVGLGGARSEKPVRELESYLDRLEVPSERRVIGGFGPKMLELARDRSRGALPFLVTPEYTARLRTILGPDRFLGVSVPVVLDADPDRARDAVRPMFGFLTQVPTYARNFRRMGFDDAEFAGARTDRFIDALVPSGPADVIGARVKEYFEAGADHVVVNVMGSEAPDPLQGWSDLAAVLL